MEGNEKITKEDDQIISLEEYFKKHPDEEEAFYEELYYINLCNTNDLMDWLEYA